MNIIFHGDVNKHALIYSGIMNWYFLSLDTVGFNPGVIVNNPIVSSLGNGKWIFSPTYFPPWISKQTWHYFRIGWRVSLVDINETHTVNIPSEVALYILHSVDTCQHISQTWPKVHTTPSSPRTVNKHINIPPRIPRCILHERQQKHANTSPGKSK